MNWGGKLLFGFVAAVLAATTVPVAANENGFASETIAACQSTTDLASLTDALTKIDWIASAPADLDDRAIRSYAATFLYHHLGFSDVPDPRIESAWTQALKNAAGARSLKQIEGGQQQDLWFVRTQTGSLLRANGFENASYGQIECVLALKEDDSPTTFRKLLAGSDRDPKTFPPVYHLQPQSSESAGLKRRLNGAILNTERISAVSDSEIDVASVFFTLTSKKPEATE
ncbi:hypothetical protein J7394_08365 [Ruegeria sp. R13_0]|uniref:hypothetical protein n=1 Tax=Ruegeria sp. R13_0 TaxID=2821099 RepID=UPI001AD9D40B|nr:hypothetical protein [Ruegeria sp. R13_0]MBO9434215.1 hypothetical protein [Ruegeria sp. R13_0]